MDAKSTLGMFDKLIKDLQDGAREFATSGLQIASATLKTVEGQLSKTAERLAKKDAPTDDSAKQ